MPKKIYQNKAALWAKILGRLPGVRAIFLSGSLAQGRGTKNSDIDFFIIAKTGHIWTARFFIFLVLKIFHQLAKPHNQAGKICPNHFITDRNLEIQEKDAYAAHLFANNKPLYDPDNIFPSFIKNNREWIEKYYKINPTTPFGQVSDKKQNKGEYPEAGQTGSAIKKGFLEKKLQKFQLKKIKKNSEYQIPGAKIILTNDELRFHPEPKNRFFKINLDCKAEMCDKKKVLRKIKTKQK